MAEPEWSTRARLKCDFTAITDEADVQDFSEHGYEVAGREQSIDISDESDDEATAEIVCD